MSSQDIKNSYPGAAAAMEGGEKPFGTKLTREHSNDPDTHQDIHNRVKVNYKDIEKSPSMEEIHAWQREHIKKDDQSKEEFPMNIILDPAMREMYQVVHQSGLTNVFDRFIMQQSITLTTYENQNA